MKGKCGFLLLLIALAFSSNLLNAQWEYISPHSNLMDVCRLDKDLFAIAYDDYIVHSNNLGTSWDTLPGFSYANYLVCSDGKLLASAVYENQYGNEEYGLYLSKDTATTWTKLSSIQSPHTIFFSDSSILLLESKNPGIESPVYYSFDEGQTWTPAEIEGLDLSVNWNMEQTSKLGIASVNNAIYAQFGHKFWISEDGGRTFRTLNEGPTDFDPDDTYRSGIFSIDKTLYMLVWDDLYSLDGSQWKRIESQMYYFEFDDGWGNVNKWMPSTNDGAGVVTAYRQPYWFGINLDQYTRLTYSLDGGSTWYKFHDYDLTPRFASSIFIEGNFVYACMATGFYRRNLSEARNYILEQEEEENEEENAFYADTSSSIGKVAGLLGFQGSGEELKEILAELGLDAEDILAEALDDFLSDNFAGDQNPDNSMMGGEPWFGNLFQASQPSSCSYMGMPEWSLNTYNLKLKLRDVIYRKKGIGPELKLALNFIRYQDSTPGVFGQQWRFEYEYLLKVDSDQVRLKSGRGSHFSFSNGNTIELSGAAFTLPCNENNNYTLHWTGSEWVLEMGAANSFYYFSGLSEDLYHLTSISDAKDNMLYIGYDDSDRINEITDGAGRIFHLQYTGDFCSGMITPDGRSASFTYNGSGMLSTSTDFEGIVTEYSYDSSGNIIEVDIAEKSSYFSYDYSQSEQGRIASITDPEERTTSYTSFPIDTLSSFTTAYLPGGEAMTWEYTNRLLTRQVNPNGDVKEILYKEDGSINTLLYPDGSFLTLDYDDDGNLVSKVYSNGITEYFSYTPEGKLVSQWDENGNILFTHGYDGTLITSTSLPNGGTVNYTYNEEGNLTESKTPEGYSHTFQYDDFGNLSRYTNPEGHSIDYLYDATGLRYMGQTDFFGNLYEAEYNDNGILQQLTLPDQKSIQFGHDCCAQTSISDQNGNTREVERDATNRILSTTDAEGNTFEYSYDENGVLSAYKNMYGSQKRFSYDKRGRVQRIADEEGAVLFSRNDKGQIRKITDKRNNITAFSYDNRNRLASITDAAGASTFFGYNEKGHMSEISNARGQNSTITYNEGGMAVAKGLNGLEYCSYDYNLDGDLISYSDSSGTTTLSRNKLGFVTKMEFPGGNTLDYSYDANGNLESISYPDGSQVTYEVNDLNFITEINWGSEGLTYSYDAVGNPLEENRMNNTSTKYTYNKNNTLLSLQHENQDSVFIREEAEFDQGVLVSLTKKIATGFEYLPTIFNSWVNELNQPVSSMATHMNCSYDADGNLTHYDILDEAQMQASYRHDNLIQNASFTDGSNSVFSISWDAMRYPREIDKNGIISYLYYDHRGRLMFECNEANEVSRIYIYRARRLVGMKDRDGNTYYYHSNRHGNIEAITGEKGSIVNAYAYSAYGEMLGQEEAIDNRFTFLGAFGALRLNDRYILAGSRLYAPHFGRFLQRDPMGIITGTNPYLYASNNPLRGIDPSGLEEQEATVNAMDFDAGVDNAYGNAAGTAELSYDGPVTDISHSESTMDPYIDAAKKTIREFTDHPIADLIPDCIGNPISMVKAAQKINEGDVGGALYQFVPFNNTIDNTLDYMDKTQSKSGMNSLNLYDRNLRMMNNNNIKCDM